MEPSAEHARTTGPGSRLGSLLCLVGGPALALVVYWLLERELTNGLSEPGRRAAAVTVWMACWWLTEVVPLAVTSLMPLVLLPALGITSAKDAATPYADRLIFLFLGGFILALGMEKWRLHERVALRTVLAVGTQPRRLILGFMLATGFISFWISNTAAAMLMIPIGMSLVRLVEKRAEGEGARFGTSIMLAIAASASIGGVATPIGSPPNAILLAYMDERFGMRITFLQWCLFGVPFAMLFLVVAWLVITRVTAPVRLRELPGGRDLIQREIAALGPISRGESAVLTAFGVAVIGWIGREPLERLIPGLKAALAGRLDDTSVAITAAVLLFLIPVDWTTRTFAMDWRTAERAPWGVLLLFGGGLSLASAFGATGLDAYLGGHFRTIAGLPTLPALLFLLAATVMLSEVTSNTAMANVLYPVMAAVAPLLGIPVSTLLVTMCLALSCAFMLPMGTPPNALVFGSGHVTIRQMARAGLVLNLVSVILTAVAAYTIIPWALGVAP